MQNTTINDNWKALIKPNKLNIQNSDDKSITTVTAEPLEKGYALTIGNSLRRILLSSIQGSAITAIQIDGVLHEFSSIKGVREDVTDIVLNVKLLSIQVMSDEPKKLILDVKGPGEVKAKDIQQNPDVKILNEDLVLWSLSAEDAEAYAARIFQDQLSLFVNFEEPVEIEKKPKTTELEFNKNLL